MPSIELPAQLEALLDGSKLKAPTLAFADRVGEILADNKLPFFPDYTDHGNEHINRVLQCEVELIPGAVWNNCHSKSRPRLLRDADAVVIVCATLLHDIAMHLRPSGFRDLISTNSRFHPLDWFRENHEGHAADRPWHELWDDYAREARRFNDHTLGSIIGLESVRQGWKFQALPHDEGKWERNHCLVIGEFLRRHHARLAHEIAIYGFPGVSAGSGQHQFPALGTEPGHLLKDLADLIGLAARSHGISLRVCQAYLAHAHHGSQQPIGTAVLYPMALLRVADYLQLDHQRAPAVLLQLRDPQSPVSVLEWQKHRAVRHIGPHQDPRAKKITVSKDVSLEVYLQLRDLIVRLQAEMDHATAVLSEAYGNLAHLGLNQLGLATRRIYSNLNEPAFRAALPYVPERTGYSADPTLLTLLVEPLYGKNPGVGVRELMQNAVDAVRELEVWCQAHGKDPASIDLPEQEADVIIDFIKRKDSTWFLRVRDKGIGMAADTLQHYFLRAGASFRQSTDWAKEFLDEAGKPRVLRTGRFGVGAFALFLLGPNFRIWTRHASAAPTEGYSLGATFDSQSVEIRRESELPIGTTVEVEISTESAIAFGLQKNQYNSYLDPNGLTDWFCWDRPVVFRRVVIGSKTKILPQESSAQIGSATPGSEWSKISPMGFDAVFWTFGSAPTIVCNGIKIWGPGNGVVGVGYDDAKFDWPTNTQLRPPKIAVVDSGANLALTAQRYSLSRRGLPFIGELVRDVILSFIAHALVCGPKSQMTTFPDPRTQHPLASRLGADRDGTDLSSGMLRWCSTHSEFVACDPWLHSLLHRNESVVYGALAQFPVEFVSHGHLIGGSDNDPAVLAWNACPRVEEPPDEDDFDWESAGDFLQDLGLLGLAALSHQPISADVMFCQVGQKLDIGVPVDGRDVFGPRGAYSQLKWTLGPSARNLEEALDKLKDATEARRPVRPEILFVAELKTKHAQAKPESLLASIWNECLGPQAIPFESRARKALIKHGCKHPELKRHIEAWEEMKRSGSKWLDPEWLGRFHIWK